MITISTEVEWKCAIMAPTIQCVMRVGLTVMLPSSVTTLVIAIHTIVSGIYELLKALIHLHTPTGSEATGGMVFGLSDETPILQNLMCNGSEYSLSDCPGYDLNGVSGGYCLSGGYQAGVRCIEGNIYISLGGNIMTNILNCSAYSNYTLLQWRHSLGEFYLFIH